MLAKFLTCFARCRRLHMLAENRIAQFRRMHMLAENRIAQFSRLHILAKNRIAGTFSMFCVQFPVCTCRRNFLFDRVKRVVNDIFD